jgi:hypothetical protein
MHKCPNGAGEYDQCVALDGLRRDGYSGRIQCSGRIFQSTLVHIARAYRIASA